MSAISTVTKSGAQAISLKVLPDHRAQRVKNRVEAEARARIHHAKQVLEPHDSIDLDPTVKYQRTESEQKAHEAKLQEQEMAALEAEEESKEVQRAEYIFLIDRSGSMYRTIELARQALILFLFSLPAGSRFNVCSYGSRYEFLFDGERSVEYNDVNLKRAVNQVKSFEADFGGTVIYEPLRQVFSR